MIDCYCSAGRGMGTFVLLELENLNCAKINVTDGKVYFSIHEDRLCTLTKLKSVERGFLNTMHGKTKDFMKGPGIDINKLGSFVLKKDQWLESLAHIVKLQHDCKVFQSSSDTDGKLTHNVVENRAVSFRICCKCSGRISRQWTPQRLSCWLGRKLSRLMGWRVELRHPQLEVSVYLNDSDVIIGIPISREPLSKRGYIRHPGLRSTVAWSMCYLLDIQPGDRILDPLCGKATILIEGEHNWKDAVYIGADISESQLKHARENVKHANSTSICLLQSDICDLPVLDGSVDRVVCDLPFGQVHKIKENINQFYHRVLLQINRVLKPGGRVVLLTSCMMEKALLDNIEKNSTEAYHGTGYTPEDQSQLKDLIVDPEMGQGEHRNLNCNESHTKSGNKTEMVRSDAQRDVQKRKLIQKASDSISEPMTKCGKLRTSGGKNDVSSQMCSVTGQMGQPEDANNFQADEQKATKDETGKDLPGVDVTCGHQNDLEQSKSITNGSGHVYVTSPVTQEISQDDTVGKQSIKELHTDDSSAQLLSPQSMCHEEPQDEEPQDIGDSKTPNKLFWTIGPSYYIKLGETHAKICTFQKK